MGLNQTPWRTLWTNDFIMTAFSFVEDTLKQLLGARRLRQRGPALALADSAVLTMEIVGEFLSLHQNKAIFTYFRRWRQVVYVLPLGASPVETEGALRFRTDEHLDPETLYRLYRVRFSMEPLFRDAKRHLGLSYCQAQSAPRLHFHFNAVLAATTWTKLEQRYQQGHALGRLSLTNLSRQDFNRHLLDRFIATLAHGLNYLTSQPDFQILCNCWLIVLGDP